MNKQNRFLLKFTLILSAFMCQADPMILQPNLGSLAEEFSSLEYSTITMIITVSALFLGIAALASGKVAARTGKKKLLLIGSILFTCGGCLTSAAPSFALIILCRIVEGLGAGFVITVSMTLIPELFPDEKEANQILGMNAVATALWGTFIGTAAGYLGVISWKYANFLYLIGFIILVFQLMVIPSDKEGKKAGGDAPAGKTTSSAYSVAVLAFLFAVVSTIFMTSVAAFIIEAGLGNSSQAGITVSIMTIGAFLIGLAFAKIFETLKSLTPAISYVFMAIGVILPVLIPTYFITCAGAFVFGMGYGTYFPYINAEAIRISPPESADANISLINGAYYIGMFASSFLMAAIASIFNNSSAMFNYRFMGVTFIIFVIYYLVQALRERKAVASGNHHDL